ncbi:unnamed protein product, partial [Oppiella nova]
DRCYEVAKQILAVKQINELDHNEDIDRVVSFMDHNWDHNQSFAAMDTKSTDYEVYNPMLFTSIGPQMCPPMVYETIEQPMYEPMVSPPVGQSLYPSMDHKLHDKRPQSLGNSKSNDKRDKLFTATVSVPSSHHVAQIVGKQGSKIKLLRQKSGVHIQTPVNGQEPVFIITGDRHKVEEVRAEIQSASLHFTAVDEERKQKFKHNSDIPGSICVNLRTPNDLIGLIVGRNGATIRNIQKVSETYIETPKESHNQWFTMTGLTANVENAKHMIAEHVSLKTNRHFYIDLMPNGDNILTSYQ